MILQLHIKNIALIEECTIDFGPKLNVLSGETGAGKSIIIDSLGFALGARADKGLIRHGANMASVEAVFDLSDAPIVRKKMSEMGYEEDDTLLLYRSMTEARSEIRIKGRMATLSMLKELGCALVDILGQHENQSLLNISSHIELLDKYGETSISSIKSEVFELYHRYKDIVNELDAFGIEQERARKIDLLKYQIDEIKAADLQVGEEEKLLADRERYRNAEKILTAVGAASSALEGGDAFGIQSAISAALISLRQAAAYDVSLSELYERLDSLNVELKDVEAELSNYTDSFEFDGATADRVERRVDLIRSMTRKYGASVEDILAAGQAFEENHCCQTVGTERALTEYQTVEHTIQ